MNLVIIPSQGLCEDYPANYIGPGHRDYLSNKIRGGYYVEVFTEMDMRQKARVDKRNQVEEIINFSSQATIISTNEIRSVDYEQKESSDKIKVDITKQRQQREQGASAQTEFNYVKYSDGKKVYFMDGLTTRIDKERVVDELGNVGIKNTYNMRYNDRRLLISYEADTKDNLGNTSHLYWYGVSYTPDSVFYGDNDTVANKHFTEYYLKEIDSAGNVRLTHWKVGSYEGKLLRAFSQTIEDSIFGKTAFNRSNITYENDDPERTSSYHEEGIGTDGLAYSLDRDSITYNNNDKNQITGYHEEKITTQLDGVKTKTTTDAQLKYLSIPHQFGADVEEADPDRLLESIITTTTMSDDGSYRSETRTTKYEYDNNTQLIDASEYSEFNGQEAQWYKYTDAQGQLLGKNEDANGDIIYSYLDTDTKETIVVPEDQVITTIEDGDLFNGTSEIQLEILYGKPMAKQAHSLTSYYSFDEGKLFKTVASTLTYNNGLVNNFQRLLGSQEHTETSHPLLDPENKYQENKVISTTYIYDKKGDLVDAQGSGQGTGWEYASEKGWHREHTSTITVAYEIILGKALRKAYYEDKEYINKKEVGDGVVIE